MSNLLLLAMLMSGVSEAKQERYEHALSLLNAAEAAVSPSTYNDFYFYRAVCQHQLMEGDKALVSLSRLEDSFSPLPTRYKALAFGMKNDIKNWGNGLDELARMMNNVSRRLNKGQADGETERQQKEILKKFDDLIDEAEAKCKLKASGSAGKPEEGKLKVTLAPGSNQSTTPAGDSQIMGAFGKGGIDEKKFREYSAGWGQMTPDKRAKVVEEVSRELPAKYKPMIDEYFKSLNRKFGEK